MLSVGKLIAQKKSVVINWHIAGVLPPDNEHKEALGLAGPVAGVSGKLMLIAGGANFPDSMPWHGGKKRYYNKIYIFKKKEGKLAIISDAFSLPQNVAYAASCSTSKGVLYAGGENETGISDKVFLIKWDHQKKIVVIDTLPALPVASNNASAISYNNIVYVVGGETNEGVTNRGWSINLNDTNAGWRELPILPKQISHSVFVAMKTTGVLKLYLVGGRRKTSQGTSELYSSVYEFNVTQQQWKTLAPLPYPLSAGTGVATNTGSILLFGGDRGTIFSKVENYLSLINKATARQEKEKLIQEKNQILLSHPGFSKEILFYDVRTQIITKEGLIPYATPVTTNAFWWDRDVVIPSGEIKAGVRTPQILMTKFIRFMP